MTDWNRMIAEASSAFGPAGFEEGILRWVTGAVGGKLDRCETDPFGNVLARTWTPGAKGRVLLVAGLDQPGILATHVDGEGRVRIAPIGPIQPRDLPGQKIRFQNGATGLVDAEVKGEGEAVDWHSLFVVPISGTVGIGEPGVIDPRVEILGEIAVGANLQWRAGTIVLAALADLLAGGRYDVTLLFSAQRSVGARAGRLAAFEEAFDWALDIGTAPAGAAPGSSKGGLRVGGGPVIRAMDRSLVVRPEMKQRLWDLAETRGIPHQAGVTPEATSDGGILAMSESGLLVGGIDIPVYKTRGSLGFLRLTDLQAALDLLRAALET
ncbi:hypothetical protein [Kyrpidia spormannii]|uniref:Uncharacterized protein n=1 Tax=Kyrpidia spormannii TaxID=2055160 RepID=A0ACA8ZDG2_9BACL|nr:hypothetical protein [Kyrpidia spormannii]CAB3395460.1 conserved protein of unknown function [Kyrpidia spormannii]